MTGQSAVNIEASEVSINTDVLKLLIWLRRSDPMFLQTHILNVVSSPDFGDFLAKCSNIPAFKDMHLV